MDSSHVRALTLFLAAATLLAAPACGGDPVPEPRGTYFTPRPLGSYEVIREPKLEAPTRVDFGLVEVGDRVSRSITLINSGRAPLEIEEMTLSGDAFTMEFPEFMGDSYASTLEPKASMVIVFTYTASSEDALLETLEIATNEPSGAPTVIELAANVDKPCLDVSPLEVDFGSVAPQASRTEQVTLTNCSMLAETEVALAGPSTVADGIFAVQQSERLREITLAPGEARAVSIVFTPPEPGGYTGSFRFTSNAEDRPETIVDVRGEGAPYQCPEAVISARAERRTPAVADPSGEFLAVPLDVVTLESTESASLDGATIERVEWTLVRRPTDSAAAFEDLSASRQNELFLDLSGDYTVELEVWDSRGKRSCEPATMQLRAIPDEDIHVQLVWDTPNDNEQLDGMGSDVDLHLLREGGIWNTKPWDCYWASNNPDWGVENDSSDDPSLDIDDLNGWGPENINLNNPENDMRYYVGVHYFSDHGYGVSYATVRVYLGGILVEELRRRRMNDQEFWHVLDIDWPSREITVSGRSNYDTFPTDTFSPDE